MELNKLHIKFKLIDYLKGKLSSEEQNRLEREAFKDPFLSDALEGFEKHKTLEIEKDLNEFNSRISSKTGKKTQRSVIISKQYLKIAASLLLLIGITFSSYLIIDRVVTRSNQQIAQNQDKEGIQKPQLDKINPLMNSSGSDKLEAEDKKQLTTNKVIIDTKTNSEKFDEIASMESSATENIAPVEDAAAGVKDLNEMQAVISEESSSSEKQVKAETEMAVEEIAVVGYETQLKKDSKEKKSSEFVGDASGGLSRKNTQENQRSYVQSATDEGPCGNTCYPVGGFENLELYISQHSKLPENSEKGKEYIVTLNFSIDEKGKIKDIKIENSPGSEYSDEAIRLLKQGPSWEPARDKDCNPYAYTMNYKLKLIAK